MRCAPAGPGTAPDAAATQEVHDGVGTPGDGVPEDDATGLLRARRELAEREEVLRLALQGAQAGVWELDLRRGRWRLDARAVEVTGAAVAADAWLPLASPAARAWYGAIHAEDAPRRAAAQASVHRGGSDHYEVEYRVPQPGGGGGWRWVSQQALVVERDPRTGAPLRAVGLCRDVTAQRDLRAELERLVAERTAALREGEARLAEAARMEALGRLAGGIAHDFNNVLQAVGGGVALARDRMERDPEAARRFLDLASGAAERGAAVTGRLLAFARRSAPAAAPVAPAALIENLAALLRHTLGPGVRLRTAAAPGTPPVLADAGQLEAVLVNLANNARDALPGGRGSVTLAAEPAPAPPPGPRPPATGAAPGWIRLSVADDGAGMPPEVLARATEPFFTTKPPGKGTGLGLAMARGFAERAGGALEVESAPGRGTVVSLVLPRAPAGDDARPAPPAPAGGAGPGAPWQAQLGVAAGAPVD